MNISSIYLAIIFCIFPIASSCQNLVNNSSFEEVNMPEVNYKWRSRNTEEFNQRSKDWRTSNGSSPDYILADDNKIYNFKKYNTKFKNLRPKDGNICVGIRVYGCQNKQGSCREYIQNKLIEPLQVGEEYLVEFWVSRLQNSSMINNIGIYFSEEHLEKFHIENLGLIPQVLKKEEIGKTPYKWEKISGIFKADKSYNFITIGNLFLDEHTKVFEKSNNSIAYYFIDQISIIPTEELKFKAKAKKANFEIDQPYVLNDILFEYDKTILLEKSNIDLENLLVLLKHNLDLNVKITGHTDKIGSNKYNQELSRKRASSIKDFLVKNGISSQRLKTEGKGSEEPLELYQSQKEQLLNRRVEIELSSNSSN